MTVRWFKCYFKPHWLCLYIKLLKHFSKYLHLCSAQESHIFGITWDWVLDNWMFIVGRYLIAKKKKRVIHYIWDKRTCPYPKHLPQVWVPKPKGDIGNMEPFGLGLPSSFLLTSTSCSTSRCHSKRLCVRCYRCQRIILWGWQEWKMGKRENVGAERGNRRRKSEEEVKDKNRKKTLVCISWQQTFSSYLWYMISY